MTAPLAYRARLARQNIALFHWSADDGDVLTCRSGQVGTYSRASGDTVVTATGTASVGIGQPRWLDTPYGASALMLPASTSPDNWTFTCDWLIRPLSIYVAGYIKQPTDGTTASPRILRLGDGSANTIDLVSKIPSGDAVAQYLDGSTNPSITLNTGNPSLGDYVEFLLQLDATQKLTLTRVVNLGTPVVSTVSSAGAAFSGGFHGGVVNIAGGANAAKFAYRHILILADG